MGSFSKVSPYQEPLLCFEASLRSRASSPAVFALIGPDAVRSEPERIYCLRADGNLSSVQNSALDVVLYKPEFRSFEQALSRQTRFSRESARCSYWRISPLVFPAAVFAGGDAAGGAAGFALDAPGSSSVGAVSGVSTRIWCSPACCSSGTTF